MSDLIRVVDMEIWTQIGVPEEERADPQRLLISLEMHVASLAPAAQQDDVTQTVNYHEVTERLKVLAMQHPRKLIETLAENIADDLLEKFPIQTLTIEVKKFILPDTKYVSVEITRP